MFRRLIFLLTVLAVAISACGGQPETCDEVADETVALMQDLIDEVESELGDMSVEELLATFDSGEELPSVVSFDERAEKLSERAGELGCTQDQLEIAVAQRTDQLQADTPLGQFIIEAIKGGGL